MKPFTSTDAAAAGLPHASASALGGTSDQTKRRGIAGLVLFVFLLFAYNATSPSMPSQNSVVRNQEVYDTSALKTGGGGGNAMDGYDVRDVDPLVNGGGDVLSSRRGFRDDKKIVVLLTSTRDGDACARSIIAARDLAFLSGRVHFRVFEEASVVHDDSCLQMYCDLRPQDCKLMLRSKRLRVVRRDISGALGASVALNLVEGMVDNKTFHDDFYLSIDTNVVFTRHWDLALLQQWYSIGNSRAILSVSPPSVETRGLNNGTFFLQCSARIHSKDKDAVVEFNPPEPKLLATVQGSGAVPLLAPVLQSQYSERFHFGPLSALQDVRSDPHLAYLVVGHEYMRATRFWTKGYDFYTPTKDIFYYRYEWPLAPHEKGKSDPFIASSSRRVRTLLGLAVSTSDGVMEDLDKYRPGDLRSLQDWRAFSSIAPDDAFNESTTNHFVNCDRRLHYVPFTLPSSAAEK